MPYLIEDMKSGNLKHIYESEGKPDLNVVPVPRWDLIDIKHYASMAIQYSRGCPFNYVNSVTL